MSAAHPPFGYVTRVYQCAGRRGGEELLPEFDLAAEWPKLSSWDMVEAAEWNARNGCGYGVNPDFQNRQLTVCSDLAIDYSHNHCWPVHASPVLGSLVGASEFASPLFYQVPRDACSVESRLSLDKDCEHDAEIDVLLMVFK